VGPKYTASKIFAFSLFVISWVTIIFYPKESIRKYLPVTIFAGYLVLITHTLAASLKWWTNKGGPKIRLFHEFCFLLGPYVAGTLWIFHLTFGKLRRYILTNLIMDSILAISLAKVFPFFKIFKFNNFKPRNIFYISFVSSLILYIFQVFISRSNRLG
jgi:hypothetical protein